MKKFKVNITKAQVKSFLKASAPVVLQLTIMMLPAAISFASTGDPSAAGGAAGGQNANFTGITPLDKPLQTITSALTGPIPILVTGGGVALAGMSLAMGWEQQVMSRGVKVAGGGAIAMGAGNSCNPLSARGLPAACFKKGVRGTWKSSSPSKI